MKAVTEQTAQGFKMTELASLPKERKGLQWVC